MKYGEMTKGFPRPRTLVTRTVSNPKKGSRGSYGKKWENKSYPHPYTAEETNLARINRGRLWESVSQKVCGTCGNPVEEDLVGLIICNPHTNNKAISIDHKRRLFNSESGPYHLKCLALNFTMCPMLSTTKTYIPAIALWDDVKDEIVREYQQT